MSERGARPSSSITRARGRRCGSRTVERGASESSRGTGAGGRSPGTSAADSTRRRRAEGSAAERLARSSARSRRAGSRRQSRSWRRRRRQARPRRRRRRGDARARGRARGRRTGVGGRRDGTEVRMLALIAPRRDTVELLEELEAEGLMPRLAELRESALPVEAQDSGDALPRRVRSRRSGVGCRSAEHGLHYPFMWDASEQRVRYVKTFAAPADDVDADLGRGWDAARRRCVRGVRAELDSTASSSTAGSSRTGACFGPRLPRRPPTGIGSGVLGRTPRAEEVFGEPSERVLRGLAKALVAGPGRAADLVLAALPDVRPDVMVVGLPVGAPGRAPALGSRARGQGDLGSLGRRAAACAPCSDRRDRRRRRPRDRRAACRKRRDRLLRRSE